MAWYLPGTCTSGNGGNGNVVQNNTLVPDGQTVIVDTLPLAEFCGAIWHVMATDFSNTTSSKIVVGFNNSGVPTCTLPTITGRDVSFSVDLNIVGANLELSVTNDHGADFTAKVVRIGTRV